MPATASGGYPSRPAHTSRQRRFLAGSVRPRVPSPPHVMQGRLTAGRPSSSRRAATTARGPAERAPRGATHVAQPAPPARDARRLRTRARRRAHQCSADACRHPSQIMAVGAPTACARDTGAIGTGEVDQAAYLMGGNRRLGEVGLARIRRTTGLRPCSVPKHSPDRVRAVTCRCAAWASPRVRPDRPAARRGARTVRAARCSCAASPAWARPCCSATPWSSAADMTVASTVGTETRHALPFANLADLLSPYADHLQRRCPRHRPAPWTRALGARPRPAARPLHRRRRHPQPARGHRRALPGAGGRRRRPPRRPLVVGGAPVRRSAPECRRRGAPDRATRGRAEHARRSRTAHPLARRAGTARCAGTARREGCARRRQPAGGRHRRQPARAARDPVAPHRRAVHRTRTTRRAPPHRSEPRAGVPPSNRESPGRGAPVPGRRARPTGRPTRGSCRGPRRPSTSTTPRSTPPSQPACSTWTTAASSSRTRCCARPCTTPPNPTSAPRRTVRWPTRCAVTAISTGARGTWRQPPSDRTKTPRLALERAGRSARYRGAFAVAGEAMARAAELLAGGREPRAPAHQCRRRVLARRSVRPLPHGARRSARLDR